MASTDFSRTVSTPSQHHTFDRSGAFFARLHIDLILLLLLIALGATGLAVLYSGSGQEIDGDTPNGCSLRATDPTLAPVCRCAARAPALCAMGGGAPGVVWRHVPAAVPADAALAAGARAPAHLAAARGGLRRGAGVAQRAGTLPQPRWQEATNPVPMPR